MILNTGSRTDIPAFYSQWFFNRIREGYVLTRNPYDPIQVSRYVLSPDVVDGLVFCSKNPKPMLTRMSEIASFRQFWCVTITPYGRDIEPCVPDYKEVCETFCRLSDLAGPDCMSLRYDPVLLDDHYTLSFHKEKFAEIMERTHGATRQAVVSFVDLYEKTKRNFPGIKSVPLSLQKELIGSFARSAAAHEIKIHLCGESAELVNVDEYTARWVDADGCLSKSVLEEAWKVKLQVPAGKSSRPMCGCLLSADIGAYNSCPHGCRYCYANYDKVSVANNYRLHDPDSPLLIGSLHPEDRIHDAKQVSYIDNQLSLFECF